MDYPLKKISYGDLRKNNRIPEKIQNVLADWILHQNQYAKLHGDHGSIIADAGFYFVYGNQPFFMSPIHKYKTTIVWEHCLDLIYQELVSAGAKQIQYVHEHLAKKLYLQKGA